MSNTTLSTAIRNEYGGALYALAREEKLEERFLAEIGGLRAIFAENPGYVPLMQTPGIPLAERLSLLDGAFGDDLHPLLLNFLKLLTERRYFGEVLGCFDRYEDEYNAEHGILLAAVESAAPLTDAAREKLIAILEKKTGKRIRLQEKVDPALLGGARLSMGGKLYDGSVRSRFDALSAILANTTL